MNVVQPKPLKENDCVGILSTARKISLNELMPAIELLEEWGLTTQIGETIGAADHQFAGDDQCRRSDLQTMLDDPNVQAIWCARGGYGTIRILDQLDFRVFKKNPKWLIGYSDVTALHARIHGLEVNSIHATMPINVLEASETSLQSLYSLLFGRTLSYSCVYQKENRLGTCRGQLIGGNLSIIYSLLGSNSSYDTRGKILFIEDLDEYLYHIDRMLMNIKRNGLFQELSGLIVGGMTAMHDNAIPFGKNVKAIIMDQVAAYDFPVCFDFPAGHIDNNLAMIFGAQVTLEVSTSGTYVNYVQ